MWKMWAVDCNGEARLLGYHDGITGKAAEMRAWEMSERMEVEHDIEVRSVICKDLTSFSS